MANFFGKFFGRTVGDAASFAIGGSISRTIDPLLQQVENEAWTGAVKAGVSRPLGVGVLAEGVAQGQVNYDWAVEEAARTGWSKERFDRLVGIVNVGPGVSAAFELWRRGVIKEAGFRRALQRLGLEQEWIDDLVKVKLAVLAPADLARAIHRGLIPDPGLLEGELPKREGNVPAYPVYDVDALAEALAEGFDREHLGVMVGLQGNPMGAHEAAEALFRGVLTEDDYLRAISEGNTRNEWARAILEQSRQIPTARDFLENALRGYSTQDEAIAGAARHGMSAEDATLIYQNQGRPMALHQITQALARGGVFKPEPGEITDPYDASIVEGNLKPAYYDLAKANRYSYPSPFVIRSLAAAGDFNQDEITQILLELGWEPRFAGKVAAAWTAGGGSAAKSATATDLLTLYDGRKATGPQTLAALKKLGYSTEDAQRKIDVLDARRVASAHNTVITDLHTAFKKGDLKDVDARAALAALDVPDWAIAQILAAWQIELDATS